MSIINFPQNPTLYELYPFGGKTWQWNGSYWMSFPPSSGATRTTTLYNGPTFDSASKETRTIAMSMASDLMGDNKIRDLSSETNLDFNGVTNLDFNVANYDLTIQRPSGNDTVSLSILATDMTVTGGTYNSSNGVVTFINNSGGTFEVSGFTSGYTDIRTSSKTTNRKIIVSCCRYCICG